jgi:nitrite reductase/ring-hydroxylating ferredoxin subunit
LVLSDNNGQHYVAVCKSEDITEGSMKSFGVKNDGKIVEVLIGRLHGRLFACNNSCPHRGASLSKGDLKGDNVVCYMHGYEYNVFTGKLEYMKSWKQEASWVEQSAEWRKSGDLILYDVMENGGTVRVLLHC